MSQDFQKIAEEAIKQCAEYEARINQLQEQIALTKKANLVDPELVKKSVEALTKTGGITSQQADETAQLLAHDPNASLRAIQALCDRYTDAAPIVKKESDIQGGRLVDTFNKQASAAPVEDAYAAVARVLGLKMNK